MSELIKVDYENSERPTVLGRDLHKALEIVTPYSKWFARMCEYGFNENIDFATMDKNVLRSDGTDFRSFLSESSGGRPAVNHQLTIRCQL